MQVKDVKVTRYYNFRKVLILIYGFVRVRISLMPNIPYFAITSQYFRYEYKLNEVKVLIDNDNA